jgi:hypothetical protein
MVEGRSRTQPDAVLFRTGHEANRAASSFQSPSNGLLQVFDDVEQLFDGETSVASIAANLRISITKLGTSMMVAPAHVWADVPEKGGLRKFVGE